MISLRNVSKRFKRTRVLGDLSFDIHLGERVALVGSNGAGKTSLIRCLLGEYVHAGEVTIDGLAPRRHRRELLKRIGFVPQLPPPLKMPVGQLLRFAADLSRCECDRMEAIARRLGLDVRGFHHQAFARLSGGQKQKLLIAIALGRKTDILVLDEPAANLDPDARHTFFALLAERMDAAAMLISSHRLDEVAPLVNRVIELDRGEVVLDDKVADTVDLASRLSCRLRLTRPEPAVGRVLNEWGLRNIDGGTQWAGIVAGPDRLRFLGVVSRYAALLAELRLIEEPEGRAKMREPDGVEALDGSVAANHACLGNRR